MFRPGGVAGGTVYTTEATLKTAMAAVAGPKLLQIDTRFGAAVFNSAHNLDGVTLTAHAGDTLTWGAGSSITGTGNWGITGNLIVDNTSGAFIWTAPAGISFFYQDQGAIITASGGIEFIDIPNGATVDALCTNLSSIGTRNGIATIHIELGGTLSLSCAIDAGPFDNTITGSGQLNLNVTGDASASFLQTGPTLTPLFFDTSAVYVGTPDGVVLTDGNITSGLNALTTSVSTPFKASDVGKSVGVHGAGPGGMDLITTIAAFVSSSHVTTMAAASTTVVNVIVRFGTDNAPGINAAIAAMAGTGAEFHIPTGAFLIDSAILLPLSTLPVASSRGFHIHAQPGTIIVANIAQLDNSRSAIFTQPTFGAFATTFAADTVTGARTVSLVVAPSVGKVLRFRDYPGNPEIWGIYTVLSVSGPGPFAVTLDRPVMQVFTAATGTVIDVLSRAVDVHWHGNGMVITGACQRYVEMLGAFRCTFEDIVSNESAGNNGGISGGYAWSLDEASQNCGFSRCQCTQTNYTTSFASEDSEGCYFEECSVFGGTLLATISSGFGVYDCNFFEARNCKVYGSAIGPEDGVRIDTNGNGTSYGTLVQGGQFGGCVHAGVSVVNGVGSVIEAPECTGNASGIFISTLAKGLTTITGPRCSSNTADGITVDATGGANGDVTIVSCDIRLDAASAGALTGIRSSAAGGARIYIFGGRISLNNAAASFPNGVYLDGGTRCNIDGLHIDIANAAAGAIGVQAATITATGAVVSLRNTLIAGAGAGAAGAFGIDSAAGTTVRMGDGNNFDAVTTAGQALDIGGFCSKSITGSTHAAPLTATGAIPWPDLTQSDRVCLSRNVLGGTGVEPTITYTPGTGFTATQVAGDTSTWHYIVG